MMGFGGASGLAGDKPASENICFGMSGIFVNFVGETAILSFGEIRDDQKVPNRTGLL